MNWINAFRSLPEWEGSCQQELEFLLQAVEVVQLPKGSPVITQFHSACDFYLLVHGSVAFYMSPGESDEPIFLGGSRRAWTAIGWSGFRHTHRYALSAKCTKTSTLFRWPYRDLDRILSHHPKLRPPFLRLIGRGCVEQLMKSRRLMMQSAPQPPQSHPASMTLNLDPANDHHWLTRSPLFQNMDLKTLAILARFGWIVLYRKQASLFLAAEQPHDGLHILVSGTVELFYDKGDGRPRLLRTLSSPGDVISWSCLISHPYDLSARCNQQTAVYYIPYKRLNKLILSDSAFGPQLQKNLLELIAEDLRGNRAHIIKHAYQDERLAVQVLTHQLGPQLPVDSPMHKIPYLLQNHATQNDAFDYLNKMERSRNSIEKSSARLFLDILRETRREAMYFRKLQQVYLDVVQAEPEVSAKTLRNRSAAAFAEALSQIHFVVAGSENLPAQPGHIFIVNHLISHPSYKLANGFELALDTHFVSAAILLPRYGDAGVRVVRRARGDEYAHQLYYNRLGHIHVHTEESGVTALTDRDRVQLRRQFSREAARHLGEGHNLVVCPEGTSHPPDQSPGPFKAGVFRLALTLEPEPYIVPIVVANFDQSVQSGVYTALIKPPFKLSGKITHGDDETLNNFLWQLRMQYKKDFASIQSKQPPAATESLNHLQQLSGVSSLPANEAGKHA